MSKEFDIILLGVTGYTGRLVAEFFASTLSPAFPDLKWALAGRSLGKLQGEVQRLQKAYPTAKTTDIPLVVCDNDDQASVDACVARTRVMLTTAGPYIKRGTPVVDACVRMGSDYVDLSGEAAWVGMLIDKYHHAAEEKGVHIVPMSGYDSIPSDLGVLFAVKAVRDHFKQATRRARSVVEMQGQLSGGTLATGIEMARDYPAYAERARDPFAMGGGFTPRPEDEDILEAQYDEVAQCWTMPFMMASINTRVVRRSNAWLHYGHGFNYQEVAKAPDEKVAQKMARSAKMQASPDAWKMSAKMRDAGKLPKQGEGPSAELRSKSWFKHDIYAEAMDGQQLYCTVSGGDPGYGETSKMIALSALCLALDKQHLSRRGGVLTPAASGGMTLIQRLHQYSSMKFEFGKELPPSHKASTAFPELLPSKL